MTKPLAHMILEGAGIIMITSPSRVELEYTQLTIEYFTY